jgi:hypothetical protein
MLAFYVTNTFSPLNPVKFAFDPLEQFDVLTVPLIGGGLTNLSLLLALNLLIMFL